MYKKQNYNKPGAKSLTPARQWRVFNRKIRLTATKKFLRQQFFIIKRRLSENGSVKGVIDYFCQGANFLPKFDNFGCVF